MNLERESQKIGSFIKAGLLVLSLFLLVGCGVIYIPKAISVFRDDKKDFRMPINRVACKEKKISLSFDVGGKDKDLVPILKVLKEHNIKATFFLSGNWIARYPEMVCTIYEEGHDIGNHSQNHRRMGELSQKECEEQIKLVHDKVKMLTGQNMRLFRAPYDEFEGETLEAVKSLGYFPIRWNINSCDWKDYGISPMVNEICNNKNLKKGSIILCHTGTKFTKDALPKVINCLQKKGYTFEKVSDIIYTNNYVIDRNGVQREEADK